MTNNWIILLGLVPFTAGLLCIPLANNPRVCRVVGTLSLLVTLVMSVALVVVGYRQDVIFVSQLGGWQAPYGITVVFDSLSGLLIAAASVVSLGAYLHSFASLDGKVERRYFHALFHFLMLGVNLSFLTGDLFNLFVAFEIMLMASYALLVIGSTRPQLAQAYKYVMLNLLASTVFVMAAGMTYGMFGTLNIADLARIVHETQADPSRELPAGFTALGVLFLVVFGLKGAFFPLYGWLPDTYPHCPIAIAGLFGGMLTKVGVYAVARLFPLVFAVSDEARAVILPILAVAAGFTMFLGVLGAVSHHSVRRILSVHVISQVGYMVFGLALMTAWGLAGCVFYMIQHMVVKCALFLCCGIMEKHAGSDDLEKIGGLLKRDTLLAVLIFIAAMSLVGLPPLSGFFGKLVIIQEGFTPTHWWLSVIGLLTGALTLLSMLKVWSYGFWGSSPQDHAGPDGSDFSPGDTRSLRPAYAGITLLVVVALLLGFAAEPVYRVAQRAGEQLVDPTAYIAAVLGPDVGLAALPHHEALAEVD